jgi:hypothetical protein
VPDLLAQQLLLVQERLRPVQVVSVRLLSLLQELLPRHFAPEPKSSCSESAPPWFLLVLRLCKQN